MKTMAKKIEPAGAEPKPKVKPGHKTEPAQQTEPHVVAPPMPVSGRRPIISPLTPAVLGRKLNTAMDLKVDGTSPDDLMGVPLGPDPDPAWVPEEIVYYKLTLTIDGNPDPNSPDDCALQFGFSRASGTTPWVDRESFDELVADARNNDVTGLTPLDWDKESSPDIRVLKPCYVILHLDPKWNWHFLPGSDDFRLVADTNPAYCGLRHCPDAGGDLVKPVGKPGSAPRKADICHVLYFAVTDVEDAGDIPNDACNVFVQFAMDDNHYIPILVDPDIKNDGGNW